MKNLSTAVILAATTFLSYGAAWGQQTIAGNFGSSVRPTTNSGLSQAFIYSGNNVNISDISSFGAVLETASAQTVAIVLAPVGYDIESVSANTGDFFVISGPSQTNSLTASGGGSAPGPGQYTLFAVLNSPGAIPDIAYQFTLSGTAALLSAQDTLTAAVGTSARLIVIGADGVARDAGQVSIAARNDRIELTRVADGTGAGDVTVSTSGVPGMMGNLYTWAEVTGFRSEDFGSGDGTIGGGGLQIGADIEIGADMVAGLSIGYSQINAEDAGTATDGSYAYLQPYFAYRSGAWHGSASVILGAGQFEQNGGADRADVTLAAATFEGGYDYALNDMFTLTPTIGLLHGREEIDGTDGALAGTSSDSAFSQLSLGGRITHSGAQGTLFAGLHADYLTSSASSVLAEDLLQDDGWTGRVEVGGEVALSNGMDLSTSVELSGLGGMQTVSGGLTVALRF